MQDVLRSHDLFTDEDVLAAEIHFCTRALHMDRTTAESFARASLQEKMKSATPHATEHTGSSAQALTAGGLRTDAPADTPADAPTDSTGAGMTCTQDENYCVYAFFEEAESAMLRSATVALEREFCEHLQHPQGEEPHVTVTYGPLLRAGEPEVTTKRGVQELLHGVRGEMRHSAALLRDEGACLRAAYRGVDHFDRRRLPHGLIVIKAEFDSALLTALRKDVYSNIPSMDERRRAELQTLRESGDAHDATWEAEPRRWAHVTLFLAKASTPAEDVLRIEQRARELLQGLPTICKLQSVELMLAVSWKRRLLVGWAPALEATTTTMTT